jgi:hypothetical protein
MAVTISDHHYEASNSDSKHQVYRLTNSVGGLCGVGTKEDVIKRSLNRGRVNGYEKSLLRDLLKG